MELFNKIIKVNDNGYCYLKCYLTTKKDLFHKSGINLFDKNKPEEVVESALDGIETHENKYSVLSNVFI
jgi:hypothetical protein